MASALAGKPAAFVNADVVLDGEPVIGSFTVDGLTYAVTDGPYVELVGVSSGWQQVMSSQEGEGSGAAPMLASGSYGTGSETTVLTLPETVSYEGVLHIVSSVGAYAFYLSGVTSVTLPASVSDVDDRAFRSSDVASIAVAGGNPFYSSYDGVLYDACQSSLLLIPEGKQGAVRIPPAAKAAPPSAFSHCAGVDAIAADADGAAFASENGLLYTSDLTTLLRVPAGAEEITIREGCTTIAAGALEACAKLTTINAPANVTSISPDVFHAIPTVSLLAASLTGTDESGASGEPSSQGPAPQLSAVVALLSVVDSLPEVVPSAVTVFLCDGQEREAWQQLGFHVMDVPEAQIKDAPALAHNGEMHLFGCIEGVARTDHFGPGWTTVNIRIDGYDAVRSAGPSSQTYTRPGYTTLGWSTSSSSQAIAFTTKTVRNPSSGDYYLRWRPNNYTMLLDAQGGTVSPSNIDAIYDQDTVLPSPDARSGYRFLGWNTKADGSGATYQPGAVRNLATEDDATVALFAQWEPYEISFDVDSEPGDADYPGDVKDPISGDSVDSNGAIEIENPKRPGYVFQGWTIPNAGGTEAIDQDLVYQDETDGKWYVDASKLPDYAGDDGRVELTARWTSVISVDVPSSVTFYADVVTQGNESREGLASSAFGQSKVASQSEVDLRIVGLESKQVKGNDSTSLGASDILKKKDGSDLPATSDKLFSLYPATGELEEDDLKDPDATSASKPAGAVDFSLDDILLEKSFAADEFTIPAGDTLSLGYRLNLQETSTELDYDKLSTLSEGASASIANISYCFAADYGPVFWTADDDGSTLELASIKADAEKIAAGDTTAIAKYTRWMNADHRFYVKWYDQGVTEADNPTKATVYDVRIIGLNHDDKSDGSGKAGITFQFSTLPMATYRMNATRSSKGGWGASELRARMNPGVGSGVDGVDDNVIWDQVPISLRNAFLPVEKNYWNGGSLSGAAIASSSDHMFLLSYYEITSTSRSGRDTCLAGEGSTYDFFIGTNGSTSNVSNPRLVIRTLDGTAAQWIQRSPCTFGEDYPDGEFWIVNSKGGAHWNSMTADNANAVRIAPAFCL